MLIHTAKEIGHKPVTGYSQVWYSSPPDIQGLCPDGIPVIDIRKSSQDIELMLLAVVKTNLEGLQFASNKRGGGDFIYAPLPMGRYLTDGFLLSPSIVMISELENKEDDREIFPKYVITIKSQNIEDMRETAGKLRLPVKNLEKLMAEAQKIED